MATIDSYDEQPDPKCSNCGRRSPAVRRRLNLPDKPMLCPLCFEDADRYGY